MALLDLQAMQLSAPENGGCDDGCDDGCGDGCGGSNVSALLCSGGSGLSLTICGC